MLNSIIKIKAHAHTAVAVTNLTSLCCTALYARISVQCNHCKSRHQKTSAVARRLVTVFNEVLLFSLPDFPLQQCKIVVCVYEMQTTRMSNKHLIGQLTVGKEKSSEDEHWSLMMRSVRQPIAKWHGLLIWVTEYIFCTFWMSEPAGVELKAVVLVYRAL